MENLKFDGINIFIEMAILLWSFNIMIFAKLILNYLNYPSRYASSL